MRNGYGDLMMESYSESVRDREVESENSTLRQLLVEAGIDAEAHEIADRLQRLLIEELHHRVKNTLATVMAITSQSLRAAENMEQARRNIESRLIALGKAHDLLLQQSWKSVGLRRLVESAIGAFQTAEAGRFDIQGDDIAVASGPALAISMALNELCTNASKYGALSNEMGRVEIKWTANEDLENLKLVWLEKDGPPVKAPTRRGFGTTLIERALPGRVQGEANLRFEPSGLVCEFHIPMASLQDRS